MTLSKPSPDPSITNFKPKHNNNQISISFSASTANFIPLNSAAAYFAKDNSEKPQQPAQPPAINTDIPPNKTTVSEYSKPSTINEEKEMTPKKSVNKERWDKERYGSIGPNSPSNYPPTDDEPSELMSIPDVKRASAKLLEQKKLHGKNVSQSDTKILTAAWNIEYIAAEEDLMKDRRESEPEATATLTNDKGTVYIEPGIFFAFSCFC